MKKQITLIIAALLFSFGSFAITPIVGPSSFCVGSYGNFSDSLSAGGRWTSSNPSIATIDSIGGYGYGVSAGVVTITYTLSGSYVTTTVTVNPTPPVPTISPDTICVGGTTTAMDAATGGVWSSYNPSIATIGMGTGIITGVAGGATEINYTLPSGCYSIANIFVNSSISSADSIMGPSTVCVGGTITLSDLTTGGVWSCSSVGVATVSGSTGVVTGISAGTAIISYSVTGICGVAYNTTTITVINTTSHGYISGASTVYVTGTTPLYETVTGGTWSSSNPGVATISTAGVVTGVATGTATITYTITGCGGVATDTFDITVVPANVIRGTVNFSSGTPYYGQVKLWLITYNTTTLDLEAADSTVVYCTTGTSVTYQFLGAATDSFRVKAATSDSVLYSTGYVPTYHTSSYYWYSANVFHHVSGTIDAGIDINMNYGTISSGPGFISGNVTTGANKGTSGGIPVKGLAMYAVKAGSTPQVMAKTYTNASGSYTFNNLPVGQTYYIFPDSLNFITTPYNGIYLTTSSSGMSLANFIQHTISHTITPVYEGVNNINNASAYFIAFPNPTKGNVNLLWNATNTEIATVTIADISGRLLLNTSIEINAGSGNHTFDLSNYANGLYIVNVKSNSINYNCKIQVQK